MFDLFRFFMLRPPELPSDGEGIRVADGGSLAAQMKKARDGIEPLSAMRDVADAFAQSAGFVGLPGSAANATALNAFQSSLGTSLQAHLTDLKRFIRAAFDHTAAEVVADSSFALDKRRVQDSLLAVTLASVPANVDHLALYARLIDLIERIAVDDVTLNEPGAIAKALIRLLVLPKDLFPLPSPLEQRTPVRPTPPPPPAGPSDAEKRVTVL